MNKVETAIQYALLAHAGMKRKGKERPYILHPLEVLCIVSTMTEDEDVLAAAVLHDTVEDTSVTLSDIREHFGERIASIVASESENKRENQSAESTWRIRKQETIDHLKSSDRDVKLICLGDKLSNLREIARDYALLGNALWERFNQKDKAMHRWYYDSILELLAETFGEVPAIREYRELMETVFGE